MLLRNHLGALPLLPASEGRVALLGPLGAKPEFLVSSYAKVPVYAVGEGWSTSYGPSLAEAITAARGGNTTYAPGVPVVGEGSEHEVAEALSTVGLYLAIGLPTHVPALYATGDTYTHLHVLISQYMNARDSTSNITIQWFVICYPRLPGGSTTLDG